MPIYEFYCTPCNTIFSFFSKSVNTKKKPNCPKCGSLLKRQVSLFSCLDRSPKDSGAEEFPINESRLEGAMAQLASEAERLNDSDPQQAAHLMRRFSELTGVKLGDGMQEALSRLQAGQDPDEIESEMGDVLQNEDPFQPAPARARLKKTSPHRDETLYDL